MTLDKELEEFKMVASTGHGGKRNGAGRPKGSRARRSEALADRLLSEGKCPVDALVRLAERAEEEGDLGQAIGAWKSVLPYIYPRPKAVEVEPEAVIELARRLSETKQASDEVDGDLPWGILLERIDQAMV